MKTATIEREYHGVRYCITPKGSQFIITLPDHEGDGFGIARSVEDAITLAECNIELNELEWANP